MIQGKASTFSSRPGELTTSHASGNSLPYLKRDGLQEGCGFSRSESRLSRALIFPLSKLKTTM
jgi:hypothetical protein